MAIDAGASAVGLVSAMPSGPGPIPEDLIAEIAATIPPGVSSFLLTCLQDAASIIDQQRRLRVNTIQICDRLTHGSYQDLREALPGISLVQVVHVTGPEAVEEAIVNVLVSNQDMTGADDHKVLALPHDQLRSLLRKYNRLAP